MSLDDLMEASYWLLSFVLIGVALSMPWWLP